MRKIHYTLLAITTLLVLGAVVAASTLQMSNSGITFGNVQITDETMQTGDTVYNESGVYNNGNKSFTRIATYVFCPSESTKTDCDIVCDGDCGDEINTSLNNIKDKEGGTIYFMNGFYNIETNILATSLNNTIITGEYPTLNFSYTYLNITKGNEIEIYNINFQGETKTGIGQILHFKYLDGFKFHDNTGSSNEKKIIFLSRLNRSQIYNNKFYGANAWAPVELSGWNIDFSNN